MNLREKKYWKEKIKNSKCKEEIISCFKNVICSDTEMAELRYDFADQTAHCLKKISNNQDLALYILVLSSIQLSIKRFAASECANILIPTYHMLPEEQCLWLSTEINEDMTVKEYLSYNKKNIINSFNNQNYSFNDMVQDGLIDLYNSYAMFCFYNRIGNANLGQIENIKIISLELFNDEKMGFKLVFDKSIYSERIISSWCDYFIKIVDKMYTNSEEKLSNIEVTDLKDKSILYNQKAENKYDLMDAIENTLDLYKERVALYYKEDVITYDSLKSLYMRYYDILKQYGVDNGDVVAVSIPTCTDLIAIILAIWKLHAIYLPIDIDASVDRITQISKLGNASYFINCQDTQNPNSNTIVIEETGNSDKKTTTDNLAYIIFTSGSTGEPKGVKIQRDSILNTLIWRKNEYQFIESDVAIQLFSNCFDGFFTSLFTPFFSGIPIVLVDEGIRRNVYEIKELIKKYNVSTLISVPALFSAIMECSDLEDCQSLRLVTLAGDKCEEGTLKLAKSMVEDLEIINEYGPTEASVAATYKRNLNESCINNIGKPISSTGIFILDENRNIQPIGANGEIAIWGKGISDGYIGKEQITKERFITIEDKRVYLTGDHGRINDDGEMIFGGRKDHQVKIRGYRIELDEINASIQKCAYTKAVHTLVEGNELIYSFVVGDNIDEDSIISRLNCLLPQYMLPTKIVVISEMHYGRDYKVDRNKLLKYLNNVQNEEEIIEPQNQIESQICEIWKEVLKKNKIGINQNFYEIGGHSIKATMLLSKLQKSFNINLSFMQLFDNPTIEGLSKIITPKVHLESHHKIQHCEIKPYYEASSAQKRMYILDKHANVGTSYNIPFALEFKDDITKEKCENIINQLIVRHESLRTNFSIVDNMLIQNISDSREISIETKQCETQTEYEQVISNFIRRFDLSSDLLIRAQLIERIEAKKKVLLIDIHHIVADGISLGILLKEFYQLFDHKELDDVCLQYKDFSEWQNHYLKSDAVINQKQYWLEKFADGGNTLVFDNQISNGNFEEFEGDFINVHLEDNLVADIDSFCNSHSITPFMFYLSASYILFYKYCNNEQVTIGTPVANREDYDLYNSVGMFVNMLLLKVNMNDDKSVDELIDLVKSVVLQALENQTYQFEELVNDLDASSNDSPLFNVMFEMDDDMMHAAKHERINYVNLYKGIAKYDLSICVDLNESPSIIFEYKLRLFDSNIINRMIEHYLYIIKSLLLDSSKKIEDISMISSNERKLIANEFNSPICHTCDCDTIQSLFEQRLSRDKDSIAIKYENGKYTCKEVNELSNQVANYLIEHGIKKGDYVGLHLSRTPETIISVLGIIKSGAAYVPMDIGWPLKRKEQIISSCSINVIIKDSSQRIMESNSILEVNVSDLKDTLLSLDSPNVTYGIDDIVYVIYTSGTTGIPKGVKVTQRNIVNLLKWMQKMFPCNNGDCYLFKTSYTFDVSTTELFSWILGDGCVSVLSKGKEGNPNELLRSIEFFECTHINFVPTMFNAFVNQLNEDNVELMRSCKYMLLAGEPIDISYVSSFRKYINHAKIYNLYGPTECTVFATYQDITKVNTLSIGKPIDNINAFVVDRSMNLQPIGVHGELVLGGIGVTEGYTDVNATEKKFISTSWYGTSKLYHTGDIARWNDDGTLTYLGREDQQVKIRGYRIEKGEIKEALEKHAAIKEAVVSEYNEEGIGKALCAFIVCDSYVNDKDLREFLKKQIPSYMIPSFFCKVDAIPYTISGKLDKKRLDQYIIENQERATAITTQGSSYDNDIMNMCKMLLNNVNLSLESDFFECGGHSLSAIMLMNKINEKYKIHLNLDDIFENSKLADLSGKIEDMVSEQNDIDRLLSQINSLTESERNELLKKMESMI